MAAKEVIQLRDLYISADNLEDGAARLLTHIRPNWERKFIEFFPVLGGFINKLLGCCLKSDCTRQDAILVRVHGHMAEEALGHEEMVTNYKLFQAAGCGPPLYAVFKNGLAYKYLTGDVLDSSRMKDKTISQLIAKEVASVHTINPQRLLSQHSLGEHHTLRESWVLATGHKWFRHIPNDIENWIQEERVRLNLGTKEALYAEFCTLEKELIQINSPIVFCHNDLNAFNIIHDMDQGKARLLDYDIASFNHQAYDLASHFCFYCGILPFDPHCYPSNEAQLPFLRTYLEQLAQLKGETAPVMDTDVERLQIMVNKFALLHLLLGGVFWLGMLKKRDTIKASDIAELINGRLNMYLNKKEEFADLKLP